MFDRHTAEDHDDEKEMLSPNVTSSILATVIEYAQQYIADPMLACHRWSWCGRTRHCRYSHCSVCLLQPLQSANMMEVAQEWYAT
jgi:hypothetical protein